MARPTEPAPEQLDRSGESGTTVDATVPDFPELGTVLDVPVEWCDAHPGEFDPELGYHGPTTYTLKAGYMTPAELEAWHAAQEPDPPGPVPDEGLTGQTVADFLGYGDDAELVALAGRHLVTVTAMARAYTRGRGFYDSGYGEPFDDVAAVITTATARLVVNPEQNKREQLATGESVTYAGFTGWSLAETLVLNRYRKRAS